MNEIIAIDGIQIHQDKEGRYSLNDLYRAAVAAGITKDIRLNEWLSLQQTKEIIAFLNTENPVFKPIVVLQGRYGGTYGVKELVYSYATWVSAAFHLKVIRTFDTVVVGQKEWAAARIQGKLVRHDLTDVIQFFVRYAISQGSTSAPKYFMNITNMQYKALEFVKQAGDKHFRDSLTLLQHNQLMTIEFAVRQALLEGMEEGLHYKDIFQKAKAAALELAEPLKRLTGKAKEPNIPLAQRIAMVSTHTIGMK